MRAATRASRERWQALPPGKFLTSFVSRFGAGTGTPLIASEFSACLQIQGPAGTPGTLQLGAATYSVGEAAGPVQVVVNRVGGSDGAVSALLSTSNGTATTPADYTATSVTVAFAAGDTAPKTVSIPVANDTLVEGNETLNVTLSSPTGGATLGTPASAVVSIIDDDVVAPLPTLSIAGVTQAEGNAGTSAFAFTVTLSAPASSAVTVNYATADGTATAGSDYATAGGVLTFAAGTTTQTVIVNITGDATVEPNETFTVLLSAPSGATLATASASGTIVNDDGVPAAPVEPIPTLQEWALLLLAGLLGLAAAGRLQRQRRR